MQAAFDHDFLFLLYDVARLMRRIGDKMGLDPGTAAIFVAGAFVHDLGKMGALHLTPLNVGEYEGHKIAAQKAFGVPARSRAIVLPAGELGRSEEAAEIANCVGVVG